jgi:ChrB-like protein
VTGTRRGQNAVEDIEDWVLLFYRLPRVPSTPRSAVWRALKRLGVAQLGDGLVALPADVRTREALEWVAEDVVDHGGEATVWLGRPADRAGLAGVTGKMRAAIAAEYDAVIAEATAVTGVDAATRLRTGTRLARELRRIRDRDFFPPPQRDRAERAVADLTTATNTHSEPATQHPEAATMPP